MIKSIGIPKKKDSLIYDLWETSKIELTDGINVIFAPNGSGKSVMLKNIAYYAACQEGGWSKGFTPLSIGGNLLDDLKAYYKNNDYKKLLNKKSTLGEIDLEWDGVACYFSLAAQKDTRTNMYEVMNQLSDEISFKDAVRLQMSHLSEGQRSISFITQMLEKKVPDLTIPINEQANDSWVAAGKILSDYVTGLSRDGKPTLILDEPDKSMDFPNQRYFWSEIKNLVNNYQLIIASHSYFVTTDLVKDYNIIEIKKDYLQEAKLALKV